MKHLMERDAKKPISRRVSSRPGPRLFVWAVVTFFAVQIIAGLVLDYALPQITWPQLYDMLDQLRAQPRTPDVIILGSSRFECIVDAAEIAGEVRTLTGTSDIRVFNATLSGSDHVAMEHTFQKILAQGVEPRMLVIEISYLTLVPTNYSTRVNVHHFQTWADLPSTLPDVIHVNGLNKVALSRFAPLYLHRYEILKQTRGALGLLPAPPESTRGCDRERTPMSDREFAEAFQRRPLTKDEARAAALGCDAIGREIRDYAPTGSNRKALERILTDCRGRGIGVFLVGAPLSSSGRDQFPESVKRQYAQTIRELEADFDVKYFNLDACLPDHLFRDFHHAVPPSHICFGRLVARQALAPAWRPMVRTVEGQTVSRP